MTEYVSPRHRKNLLWGQGSYVGYFHKPLYQCPQFLLTTLFLFSILAIATVHLLELDWGLKTVPVLVVSGMIILCSLWGRIVLQHRRVSHWIQGEPAIDKPDSPLLVEMASSAFSLFWGCCFLFWLVVTVMQKR